eukprot:5680706-Pleurochrysis_carterae.AAC.1
MMQLYGHIIPASIETRAVKVMVILDVVRGIHSGWFLYITRLCLSAPHSMRHNRYARARARCSKHNLTACSCNGRGMLGRTCSSTSMLVDECKRCTV